MFVVLLGSDRYCQLFMGVFVIVGAHSIVNHGIVFLVAISVNIISQRLLMCGKLVASSIKSELVLILCDNVSRIFDVQCALLRDVIYTFNTDRWMKANKSLIIAIAILLFVFLIVLLLIKSDTFYYLMAFFKGPTGSPYRF